MNRCSIDMPWKEMRVKYGFLLLYVCVVVIFATLTFFAVQSTVRDLQKTAEERFANRVQTLALSIERQYLGLTATLRSMQGFFSGSEQVTREEFYTFIQTSKIRSTYPGFSTLAYIKRVPANEAADFVEKTRQDKTFKNTGYPDFTIHPAGERDEYWPIVYIDPEDNAYSLLGADQNAEAGRRKNIEHARDTNDVSISAIVNLLPKAKPGVIIVAPLYQKGVKPLNAEDRKQAFQGAISAALYIDDFLDAFIPKRSLEKEGVGLSVAIGGNMRDPYIYTQPGADSHITASVLRPLREVREWMVGKQEGALIFTAPASSELTPAELLKPIVIIAFFFMLMAFVFLILTFARSTQKLSLLREQYDFIKILSHQLRTPITGLRWTLESVIEGKEYSRAVAKNLHEKTIALANIIGKLLLFIESEEKTLQKKRRHEKIHASTLIQRSIDRLPHNVNKKKRIKIEINQGDPTIILSDIKKVSDALSYIIDNALTYSPPKKAVIISVIPDKSTVGIQVTDKGYGIPLNEQENVFKKFFRSSNASLGKNEGSAVSLYLAQKIAHQNGGEITFTSKENIRSTFTLTLPKEKF